MTVAEGGAGIGRPTAAAPPHGLLRVWDAAGNLMRDIPDASPDGSFGPTRVAWLDDVRIARVLGRTVEVWNLTDGKRERVLDIPANLKMIYNLAPSPDGRWLLGSGQQGSAYSVGRFHVLLWDLRTGQLRRVYHDVGPTTQWRSKGQAFAATSGIKATYRRGVPVFSIDEATPRTILPVPLVGLDVSAILSPDFQFLAGQRVGDYGATSTSIWNARTGKLAVQLHLFMTPRKDSQGYTDMNAPVSWLAITPNGFYDGSVGIEKWLRWRSGNTLLPVGALQKERRRPAMLRAAMSGSHESVK